MEKRIVSRWGVAAVVCLALCSSFGGSLAWSRGPDASKTFTFRLLGEPETLDWNVAHTYVETYILMNLMEGLVGMDQNLKVVPALAKSWTRSPDGKTYTFSLRQDVKWSDGVPLRAQDFVYSWKRLLSPVTAASYAYMLFDVEGAEDFYKGKSHDFNTVGVKAVDDHTLRVRLAKPVAYWLYIPTFWVTFPLRQDVVEKRGSGWDRPGTIVTLGPYTLERHDVDSKIVLRANPNYYGKKGNIEQAVGLVIKDDTTALSLYESGKLDFCTEIPTLDLKRLAGRPDLKTFPYLKTGFIGFAINNFPMSNAKVRRAIAMAIDKSKIPEILHGGQTPATSFVPPKMMAYSKKVGLPYDPVRAKAELRDAKLGNMSISLTFLIPNFDKHLTLAQFVQGELKKNLGINVALQPFDHKTFRFQLDLHSYPLFNTTWAADYPDPDNYLSLFLSTSGNNRTTWKDPSFDQKTTAARTMLDPAAREKVYLELQRTVQEREAIVIPLYYEPNIGLVKPRVQGLEINPLNYLFFKNVNLAK